jgi:hypothetical protein
MNWQTRPPQFDPRLIRAYTLPMMNFRTLRYVLVFVLVVTGVAAVGLTLWLVGPTLALLVTMGFCVVVIPSCIEMFREGS